MILFIKTKPKSERAATQQMTQRRASLTKKPEKRKLKSDKMGITDITQKAMTNCGRRDRETIDILLTIFGIRLFLLPIMIAPASQTQGEISSDI
jgi:hypothetical protein